MEQVGFVRNNIKRQYRRDIVTDVVCILTIIVTVLTQVPALSSYFRPAMYALWVLALAVGFAESGFTIPRIRFLGLYIITLVILVSECIICDFVQGTHLDSYALQVVPLPLLCYIVGLYFAQIIRRQLARQCLWALFLTAFFAFMYIFITYVGSLSVWLNANYYIYIQKNSAAQIIGCTMLLTAFLINPEKKWINVIKYIALAVMFVFIVAMQCRTALVGLLTTAAVYYFLVLHGRKKILATLALVVLVVLVINSDTLMQYVTKAFVFTERQSRNLDGFVSGRITLFGEAWQIFREHPFVGTGHYRVDDFYLCLLSDVGLIGFVPIITLWIVRIYKNVSAFFVEKTAFTSCVLCLTVFYFMESLFEAYPPFGPGVCTFMFWVVCAFLDIKGALKWEKEKAL